MNNAPDIKTPSELHQTAKGLYTSGSPVFVAMQRLRPFICPFGELIFEVPDGASVLDIGCGGGLFLALLATEKKAITGVGFDSSAPAIAAAKEMQKTHPHGQNIEYLLKSVDDAWPEGEFDVVSMIDVVHHIQPADRKSAILKACAQVRPGGTFIYKDMATRPKWMSWANTLHDILVAGQFTRTQEMDEVISWCEDAGMEVQKTSRHDMLWYAHEMTVLMRPASG